MFGDMMKMMGQLKDARKKAEESKERLSHTICRGSSSNGLVHLDMTAAVEYRELHIDEAIWDLDRETIKTSMEEAIRNGLEKAKNVQESEMKAMSAELIPPGMEKLFGS
jgi:DNA-binding protein YbaB